MRKKKQFVILIILIILGIIYNLFLMLTELRENQKLDRKKTVLSEVKIDN